VIKIQFSYSRVDSFRQCPYKWKLHYLDHIDTIVDQQAANALYVGSALHKGIETNVGQAIKEYLDHYYVITDLIVNEVIKLELLIPKVKEVLKDVEIFAQEYEINTTRFKGFVDIITSNPDGTVDVFDFKYSNNVEHYMQSGQLHIYKYYLEQQGLKVNKLGFIFIPKTSIRQKQTEDLYQFRKRLIKTVNESQVQIVKVPYNPNKVIEFLDKIVDIKEETEFPKNETKLCDWCDYQQYCKKGIDYMILPTNQRRERKIDTNPDMWIYADSYVGKSTFVDQFNDLLFLNTDGNTDNTTSPVIRIADEVTFEGRLKKTKMAWDVFLEVILELEKKDNQFKRVCIDLVEDLYEHCRLYVYDKLGIQHEQDAGFGKGWDMVRTEYLSAIKRLKNLGYQIIYISKESVSEITLKNGSKLTTIKPNINDKVANVLAGTVDLTVRAYMDDEDRFLQLEKKENVFGGGRFNFKEKKIPLKKDAFIKVLQEAQAGIKTYSKMEESPNEENQVKNEQMIEEQPKEESQNEALKEEPKVEDKPVRHRKKKAE
jgi:CRISPR/Cas system-associated exonuclease Cas4 (RecB family)